MIEQKQGPRGIVVQMAELHFENLFAFRTILEHEEFGDSCRSLFKQMAHTIAEHHSLIQSSINAEIERACEDKICRHIEMVQKEANEEQTELRNVSPLYRNWDETARLAESYA